MDDSGQDSVMKRVRDYIEATPRSITLYDIDLTPRYSNIHPTEVDLSTRIGSMRLHVPIFGAPMDTVTDPTLAKALSVIGACGILYRHPDAAVQLAWAKEVLEYQWCIVKEPITLRDTASIDDARRILHEKGYSTIPVLDEHARLSGVLFTHDVAFKRHLNDPVSKWMMPIDRLKTEWVGTSFKKIQDRLLHEQECSVLPIIGGERRLHGMYFMKDVMHAHPSRYAGKPVVGIAIGVSEKDAHERARKAYELGASVVVIDSSHGDCTDVVEQTKRVRSLCQSITIIAGNVADVTGEGYLHLAHAGADAIKVGIGSGSICTTTTHTGAGVGMVTAIRACVEARKLLGAEFKGRFPSIIADGGINQPGDAVKALLVGADAVMAGKWLVAASESRSAITRGITPDGKILYRGMASKEAIADRSADRYGKKKKAAEGVSGFVQHRGRLIEWIQEDLELMRSGFAHAGAENITALHQYGNQPGSWSRYSSLGRQQASVRVDTE